MKFLDREREKKELKAILGGEPDVVYFVYGPINSGKTALLTEVFSELSDNYLIFYINFRRKYIAKIEDLLEVLFEIKEGKFRGKLRKVVREFLKEGTKKIKEFYGIPISYTLFELIFEKKRFKNIFVYLEEVFKLIKEEGRVPVFVLDEIQSIKEVVNSAGKSVLSELFNFMIGMTKETHLCHCLCATSDCLFIEEVYNNARLEGRARYVLVDDLDRERAYEVYKALEIEDKELVWDYVGGKFGDILGVLSYKRRGYSEKEAVSEMVRIEAGRLRHLKLFKLGDMEGAEEIWNMLKIFSGKEVCSGKEAEEVLKKGIFWIRENVLFYNPVSGEIKPQGRLIWKAIKELQ